MTQRITVVGAGIVGLTTAPRLARRPAQRQAADFLPDLTERIHASDVWTGLRPATPDGKPRLGPTGVEGLWLNAGHGALGWTLSMGSALVIRRAFEGNDTALAPFRLSP